MNLTFYFKNGQLGQRLNGRLSIFIAVLSSLLKVNFAVSFKKDQVRLVGALGSPLAFWPGPR
jgi:hypothetical protein